VKALAQNARLTFDSWAYIKHDSCESGDVSTDESLKNDDSALWRRNSLISRTWNFIIRLLTLRCFETPPVLEYGARLSFLCRFGCSAKSQTINLYAGTKISLQWQGSSRFPFTNAWRFFRSYEMAPRLRRWLPIRAIPRTGYLIDRKWHEQFGDSHLQISWYWSCNEGVAFLCVTLIKWHSIVSSACSYSTNFLDSFESWDWLSSTADWGVCRQRLASFPDPLHACFYPYREKSSMVSQNLKAKCLFKIYSQGSTKFPPPNTTLKNSLYCSFVPRDIPC